MKPIQVFGIIIRVFGLSLFVYSIWYFVLGVALGLGLPEPRSDLGLNYLINGFTFLVLGLYLLRGAPHILRFSYPKEEGK